MKITAPERLTGRARPGPGALVRLGFRDKGQVVVAGHPTDVVTLHEERSGHQARKDRERERARRLAAVTAPAEGEVPERPTPVA